MLYTFVNSLMLIATLSLLSVSAWQIKSVVRESESVLSARIIGFLFVTLGIAMAVAIYCLIGLVSSQSAAVFFLALIGSASLCLCSILLRQCIGLIANVARDDQSLMTDSVTGIYNRRYCETRVEEEVARSKRYSAPLTVLAVGLTNFHKFNEVYGFQYGDHLLRIVAKEIGDCLRDTDIVTRYDNDRYVLILTDTPESNIRPVINRLRYTVNSLIDELMDVSDTGSLVNVKFGDSPCSASTRSGRELIDTALAQLQSQKTLLNKEDTSVVLPINPPSKVISAAA